MAECSVTVDSTDQMSYDTKEITVDTSCKEFTIRLTFSGNLPKNVMGHNLVVSKTADMQGIATEGMAQGLEKDYLNKANPNIIAHTAMIGAEEKETSVTFDPSKLVAGGDYSFFCTFPGHISMMKGKVVVK
ncbi:azurin [Streptomyces sp. NPDC048723]|uniref:azurin n=1 Tax=Streptomyces sp. NPDC048723 TaxID=3365589 RepID=UPI0037163566